MAAAVSYAGVSLPAADATLVGRVLADMDPRDIYSEASPCPWPPRGPARWPGLFPAARPFPPVRLNHLHWPYGASRWAVAHLLATGAQLASIRTAVYGARGISYTAQPLVLDDGRSGHRLTTSLWMLPPRPLAQITGSNGLSLLTLVDDRYRWWEVSADVSIVAGTTTWAVLLASIASALGITLTVDSIAAAYLKPPSDLVDHYQFLPLLLDAVCACVGQRLVRSLAGVCTTQNALTAKASQDAQAGLWPKGPGGGGTFAFAAGQ